MAFYTKGSMRLHHDALDFILNDYEPIQEVINTEECIDLSYFSEYKRNNELFRAHPNYKQEGEWYDWVMIRWEPDQRTEQEKDLKKSVMLEILILTKIGIQDTYILLVKYCAFLLQTKAPIMLL